MTNLALKAGILGAGFISEYHVDAIKKQAQVELVSICDMNEQAANKLALSCPGVKVYTDLSQMLEKESLDVVHLLTQPDSHYVLAKMILESGRHVVIEKPVTVDSLQAEELAKLAADKGLSIAINHNFVFSRPFNRLKQTVSSGELGPLKTIKVVWKKVLPQMKFGPWNLWMLREAKNILFETGSHSLSELLSIVDDFEILAVEPRLPKLLPSGSYFYRRWDITARAGEVSIHIDLSFDQGYEQHFVEVEGVFGVATADMENDIFLLNQPTGRGYDVERLHVNVGLGWSRIKQGVATYFSYAASKFLPSMLGGPYNASMLNGIAHCYLHIHGKSLGKESSIEYGISIAKAVEKIQSMMPDLPPVKEGEAPTIPTVVTEPQLDAKVLIIGGSGFIGKRLLLSLKDQNKTIRVVVRNASSLIGVDLTDNVEVMVGDFRNESVMDKALSGIDVVYHLAVAHSNSLSGYIAQDSLPTLKLARQCQQHNVKRFIYTGTIDSLDLAKSGLISESDGVDGQLSRRNNYAHSKAITEMRLNELYVKEQFPLVIIRPAIVLGAGGPVDHPGVANWSGLGRCSFWGNGNNKLPLILVDDVVSGLVKAFDAEGIEGNTYNLSATSCISARQYVAEVEKILGSKVKTESSSPYGHWCGDSVKWVFKVLAGHPDKKRIPSVHDWRCRQQQAGFDTSKAERDLQWAPENDPKIIVERGIHEPAQMFLEG